MADPSTSPGAELLKPYFNVMLQPSSEFTALFDEAIRLTSVYGNGRLHLEHVFFAMLNSGPNPGKELLMSVGIDIVGLESNLKPYLEALPKLPPEPAAVSSNVHDALSGAADEAKITNHHQVESVHFLLSAVKVTPENPLWHLHDITYEKLIRYYTQSSDTF